MPESKKDAAQTAPDFERVAQVPDFLWSFVGPLNYMRLSLKKAFQSARELIAGILPHNGDRTQQTRWQKRRVCLVRL
jgi:hypothetical protein